MTTIKLLGGEIELLRVDDIAKGLGVNKETIRRYIRQGKIKAQKIGRRYFVSADNLKTFTNGGTPATR